MSRATPTARAVASTTTPAAARAASARDPDVPIVEGSQAAYDALLPVALKLDPATVRPFRYDGSLAYHNVSAGLAAVLPFEATLRDELPRTNFDVLRDLPNLALAVIFANDQVDRGAGRSTGTTAGFLKRAFAVRTLLLDAAVALVGKKRLPRRSVDKIREGHGNIDAAADCVALAALFTKHWSTIKGRHAVEKSDVAEASTVGNELLTILRPKRTRRRATPAEVVDAADRRDRLWTLLVEHFEGPHGLERAAMHLWGRAYATHVPALLSFAPAPRAKAAPAAAPSTPATT